MGHTGATSSHHVVHFTEVTHHNLAPTYSGQHNDRSYHNQQCSLTKLLGTQYEDPTLAKCKQTNTSNSIQVISIVFKYSQVFLLSNTMIQTYPGGATQSPHSRLCHTVATQSSQSRLCHTVAAQQAVPHSHHTACFATTYVTTQHAVSHNHHTACVLSKLCHTIVTQHAPHCQRCGKWLTHPKLR
jgi:hypothetical protein